MSLETFVRQYWLASSYLKGRLVSRPINKKSAENCMRELARGSRWHGLRRAAVSSATVHDLIPKGNEHRAEWLLPCDTEPEAGPEARPGAEAGS